MANNEGRLGHWILVSGKSVKTATDPDGDIREYECSLCHVRDFHVPNVKADAPVRYCWNCGACMVESRCRGFCERHRSAR